ncbi:MAG: hypothetical protein WDW38_000547 [Sanguina aurantia]
MSVLTVFSCILLLTATQATTGTQEEAQLGLNGLSDLSTAEFKQHFIAPNPLSHNIEEEEEGQQHLSLNSHKGWRYENVVAAPSVDWRELGVVGPIRSQHANNWSCGSCWAFATVGVSEIASAQFSGVMVPGSEQQLIDCDHRDHGCDGGAFKHGLDYIIDNGGLSSEEKYPYAGRDNKCVKGQEDSQAVRVSSWEAIPPQNETAMAQALTLGPVVTAVCCGDDIDAWHAYVGGVFDAPCCVEKIELDHAMVVVGYGTSPEGDDYWLMKNSWSDSWGEAGFMKMKRNDPRAIGHCAVASMPTMVFRGPKPPASPSTASSTQSQSSKLQRKISLGSSASTV